jgi:hypothetical protein
MVLKLSIEIFKDVPLYVPAGVVVKGVLSYEK